MADKEATVYIIDVSQSMKKKHQGREESDLDWAMRYVWDKITTTVATGRKTANIGVLGLGTDETQNELGEEEGYQHISVLHPISQVLMPNLRRLQASIHPSSTDDRDAISALILAAYLISMHCKKLKYIRRITLVTNGSGGTDFDSDNVDAFVKKIKDEGIQLTILGVDFDDPGYGFKEEDKFPVKTENEKALHELVERCDGQFGTLLEAINELETPRVVTTRPVATYKGHLTLGNPASDSLISIDVERYPRTAIRKPPNASSFVLKSEGTRPSSGDQDAAQSSNLTNVRSSYTYHVADGEVEGGKRDVPREELAKGYEYGRTAVYINETDENITKLETETSMEILGFVDKNKVERYILLDVSNIITPLRTSDEAIFALSSLTRALYEFESCAIARVVRKDMSEPLLKLLSPSITVDYECLIENELPFAEDHRSYRFPPIDKIVTMSGKVLPQHRNLPSGELTNAMGDFVDKLDLSIFEQDDNEEPAEYMALEDTFSPLYHRIEVAKRWRAVHPTDPVPPIAEILMKYSKLPEELREASKSALQRLTKVADVKKVPPKVKGRKRNRDLENPLSGLDVEDLFRSEKRTKISPENAIPEFKQTLAIADSLDTVKYAVQQMTAIIEDQIKTSFGDIAYNRAVEGLGVMRQELVELEEPGLYNAMLRELKRKIMAKELGGNRREMWWFIRRNRIGLIDKRVSSVSGVTEDEANEFMRDTL